LCLNRLLLLLQEVHLLPAQVHLVRNIPLRARWLLALHHHPQVRCCLLVLAVCTKCCISWYSIMTRIAVVEHHV
jgi:hypothetical protein